MKILHVIVGLSRGGAELMLTRLTKENKKNNLNSIIIISLTSFGDLGAELRKNGAKVIALGFSKKNFLFKFFLLIKVIKEEKPDIVQTWMYHSDLLGGIAAKIAGVKRIFWGIRTTDPQISANIATQFIRLICARLSRLIPDTIVCAAHASLRSHKKAGYDEKKLVVIPNGYDLDIFQKDLNSRNKIRSEFNIHENEILIGLFGRFNQSKDHMNFIKSAGIICKNNHNVKFMLIGKNISWENHELEREISELEINEKFILVNERKNIENYFQALDIYCSSSRTEGFPNVVAEAMASAKPCVVTNVGDAADLVSDTGIVVPKENPIALANGMLKVIGMTEHERLELGDKARRRINSKYSINKIYCMFNDLYSA